MSSDSSRDDVRDLLGAYALNALDADERAQVDALLLADASARAELHELEHAAAWLGHASLRPSSEAWDAIASELAVDDERAQVVAPPQSPASPRRPVRWLVAAAVALVLAAGTAGVIAFATRSTSSDTVADQARAAARDGDARTVLLTSTDGAFSANVLVLPDGTGFVRTGGMPDPGARRDLQLWSITPSGPVSAGVMPRDGWYRFRLADGANAIAVTNERAGGNPTPTAAPVATGELT